jgi:5-methylcytosine-specific restriction protein B
MKEIINKAKALLKMKKNIILQGAPGTGKTYNTAAIALSIIGAKEKEGTETTI